jgi:hypothetical protein
MRIGADQVTDEIPCLLVADQREVRTPVHDVALALEPVLDEDE